MQLVPLHDAGLPAGLEVHRLDLDLEAVGASVAFLSAAERQRMACFAQVADRARFAQTRAALRCLLGKRLGCLPLDVPLASGAHGKPCIEDVATRAPVFNVSHAGAHALIALADGDASLQLGIDIEQCRQDWDVRAMLDLAFMQEERDAICASQDVPASFCVHWVAKEAVLKAIGVGVATHLRAVAVRSDGARRWRVTSTVPEWDGAQALSLAAPPGYAAAVAWYRAERPSMVGPADAAGEAGGTRA